MNPLEFPPPALAETFHRRLLNNDPTASADVCEAYLLPLQQWLADRFHVSDSDSLPTAAHEALLAYCKAPARFDPAKGSLAGFLCMAAKRDLWNLLRREGRHHRGRVAWSSVEMSEEAGNLEGGPSPVDLIHWKEEEAKRAAFLEHQRRECDPRERIVLDLLLEGERDTECFARALGLHDLTPLEQQREVKQLKDRIKKRLQREANRESRSAS